MHVANYATIAVNMATTSTLSALMPKTRQALLRELVLADGEYIHVREMERRTGIYAANLSRELRKLQDGGLVESRKAGRQLHYRLNPQCSIYPEIKMMILKTVGLADLLREALEPLAAKVRLAYIYGSFASGTGRPGSDIDLIVAGSASSREVYAAAQKCADTLRRNVHAVVYPSSEYAAKVKLGRGFVFEAHRRPKIILLGDENGLE